LLVHPYAQFLDMNSDMSKQKNRLDKHHSTITESPSLAIRVEGILTLLSRSVWETFV
jgi:hypothetical protein